MFPRRIKTMASTEDRKEQQENSDTPEDQTPVTRQRKPSVDSARSPQQSDFMNCVTDEAISLDDLQKLKLAFEDFEMGGLRTTDVKNFGRILKNCLDLPNTSDAQIQGLFKKIDYSGRGRISWGELCAYMLQEYKERQDTVRRRKQVAFILPATMKTLDHGFPIVNIRTGRSGSVVSVREDGLICQWSPELRTLKTKDIFTDGPSNTKSKWASDFTLMTEHDKLIIGTGDREIQFYELSSLEPYCQITTLETVPLTLDYCATGCDKCCILYGDTEGCVTIILFSFVGDTLRLWNKLPGIENVPSITMDNVVLSPDVTFVRWKIHQDWVTQAKYFAGVQAVVSSSRDESSSLVIGCVLPLTDTEQQLTEIREVVYKAKAKKVQLSWTPQLRAPCDQRVFTVHKGVKTFDLCCQHSLLVTGGLDRLVRMWNPIFPGKPTGLLKGHSAPIAYLSISSEDSRIFSVSTDGTAKIWDIQDQCCLFTAEPKASGIGGDIAACSYSAVLKTLYVAADSMTALSLKTRTRIRSGLAVSHNEPVTCCGFSQEFRQVVSCCEGSIIKVWDFDTGHLVFEFGGTHDLTVITCMAFDPTGRRLVTGEKGGCLKIWNFNNGQCLKTLRRGGAGNEVCDCIFFKVHRNSYVMSVGHDRKIDIYSDIPEDFHHVRRPQPPWQDDVRNGHKEDILCVAHCPPALLATGSYDGEIIVWNVVSGCIVCRFISPSPEEEQRTGGGNDSGVSSIVFVKECRLQQFSLSTALVTSGAKGCINLWSVLSGGKLVVSFRAPSSQEKITKLARTAKTALLYAADQSGFIYVYDIEGLDPEQKSPKAENVWRAHNSRITGLQIVDNDQAVLTSSTDRTLRLWSARGELIGTFGQSESWSVPVPLSWQHPAASCEDTNNLSCTHHGETLSFNTNLPDGAAAGDTRPIVGQLKAAMDELPLSSECDEDAEEGQAES